MFGIILFLVLIAGLYIGLVMWFRPTAAAISSVQIPSVPISKKEGFISTYLDEQEDTYGKYINLYKVTVIEKMIDEALSSSIPVGNTYDPSSAAFRLHNILREIKARLRALPDEYANSEEIRTIFTPLHAHYSDMGYLDEQIDSMWNLPASGGTVAAIKRSSTRPRDYDFSLLIRNRPNYNPPMPFDNPPDWSDPNFCAIRTPEPLYQPIDFGNDYSFSDIFNYSNDVALTPTDTSVNIIDGPPTITNINSDFNFDMNSLTDASGNPTVIWTSNMTIPGSDETIDWDAIPFDQLSPEMQEEFNSLTTFINELMPYVDRIDHYNLKGEVYFKNYTREMYQAGQSPRTFIINSEQVYDSSGDTGTIVAWDGAPDEQQQAIYDFIFEIMPLVDPTQHEALTWEVGLGSYTRAMFNAKQQPQNFTINFPV